MYIWCLLKCSLYSPADYRNKHIGCVGYSIDNAKSKLYLIIYCPTHTIKHPPTPASQCSLKDFREVWILFNFYVSFRRGFYFETSLRGATEVCRVVPRVLDVPLVLMAAGLAEGRTEEGERGGVEPEKTERRGPSNTDHRHADRRTAVTPTTAAVRPADWHWGGWTDAWEGNGCFCLLATGGFYR